MLELLPYILLLMAILAGWVSSVRASLIVLLTAVAAGLIAARLNWVSLPAIALLGVSLWLPTRAGIPRVVKALSYLLFLILALAMSNFMVPGFNNLRIFENIQFSPDSVPFTMYLNFDKILVGLFIILFFHRARFQNMRLEHLKTAALVLLALVAVLLPLALAISYVRIDAKFPAMGWIWALNNLFFVCLAEEGLFRGFIQGGLQRLLPEPALYSALAILVGALAFGAAHYRGGIAYVILAAVAGVFYGITYYKTKRLEASMAVHFGLNLIHFLFFSYPALM